MHLRRSPASGGVPAVRRPGAHRAPPAQLIAAIRTVHAGDGLLAPASTRRLIEQFTRPTVPGPKLVALTARESDVLRLQAVVFAYENGLVRPGERM